MCYSIGSIGPLGADAALIFFVMAERVNLQIEQMVMELSNQQRIFSESETKEIVRKRTDLEYKINRMQPKLQDFEVYIAYEIQLELLRSKRAKRLKIKKSDPTIVKRIHYLYQRALAKFKFNESLWVKYFEFAKQANSTRLLGKIFAQAIRLHPKKPIFWIMAAAWEFEENANINGARVLLQRGLRLNSDELALWKEYFRLEVMYLKKLSMRNDIIMGGADNSNEIAQNDSENEREAGNSSQGPQDESENVVVAGDFENIDGVVLETLDNEGDSKIESDHEITLESAISEALVPKAVFQNGVNTHSSKKFALELFSIACEYRIEALCKHIEGYLLSAFENDFEVKDLICRQYLIGVDKNCENYPVSLQSCIERYEEFLSGPSHLWQLYYRFLKSEQMSAVEENLVQFFKIYTCKCLESVSNLDCCSLEMYLDWINMSAEDKIHLSQTRSSKSVLVEALSKFPDSLPLWQKQIVLNGIGFFAKGIESLQAVEYKGLCSTYLNVVKGTIEEENAFRVHLFNSGGCPRNAKCWI
jgi:U3 small nucleolar RNA-associated protein 6